MKIKKALCLLVAFAVMASIGAMPVFADEIGTDFDFAEAPNELAGGTDTADDFLADVPGLGEITLPDTTGETVSMDEILEYIASWVEFRAENVRLAVSLTNVESTIMAMGLTNDADGEPRTLTELTNAEVMEIMTAQGFASMADVAEWIETDLLPYTPMPMILYADSYITYLKVVPAEGSEAGSGFSAKYGEANGSSFTISKSADADDKVLTITADTGSLLTSVDVTQGGGGQLFYNKEGEPSTTITADKLKGTDVFPDVISEANPSNPFNKNGIAQITIAVTTIKAQPKGVRLEGEGEPTLPGGAGVLSWSAAGGLGNENRTMDEVKNDIGEAINNKQLGFGSSVTISGDPGYVVGIGKGESGNTPRCTVQLSDTETVLKIAFKKTSGGVKFDDKEEFPDHVIGVTVGGNSYSTLDTLNTYLKTLYEGTTADLVFTLADNYRITKSNPGVVGSDGITVKGIVLTAEKQNITLTITYTGKPTVTISKYAVDGQEVEAPPTVGDESTEHGQMIIAEVSNAAELSDETLNGASLTITGNVTSEDNEEYKGQSITKTSDVGGKNPNYVGLIFVPKNKTDFQFSYSVGVTATLNYGSGESASNTRAYTIGK